MKLIKIGGSVIAFPTQLKQLCNLLINSTGKILIVPGGGSFTDRVRDVDSKFGLSPTTAHWMAILGMDQFALLLSNLLPHAQVINEPKVIKEGLAILRPSKFLEKTDPLPHSWNITSDSITAYFANLLGLKSFIKITVLDLKQKSLQQLVDPYLPNLLSKYNLDIKILSIFNLEEIRSTLQEK